MKTDPQKPANVLSGMLARIETVLIGVACVALASIMCIVVLDVVMRYAFAAPLLWSYDLIGLYLIGAVFFLALPDTMHRHGHIALDVFMPLFPLRLRHIFQGLGYGASTVLVGLIAWLAQERAYGAFLADDRIASAVPWPTWVAYATLTIGMALLFLRCAYRAYFHLISAVLGRDLVELPPPPLTENTSGWNAK
jgi:TRAP-type C4-dicarboxylate transport system permease small subunit